MAVERVLVPSRLRPIERREIPLRTVYFGAIAHGYQPPREFELPSGLGRLDITLPDASGRTVNTRILDESYRNILANERGLPPGLTFSYYASLRSWMNKYHHADYERSKRNIKQAPEREYRVLGDPLLHVILPLLPDADQLMLINMGREAFRRDFDFIPEGLWLPEAAVSKRTLELASEVGYKFVVLRDDQIKGLVAGKNPYEERNNPLYIRFDSGKEIAVVHFDSGASSALAFDDQNEHTSRFQDYLGYVIEGRADKDTLVTAVDMETYGHHHPGRDQLLWSMLEATDSGNYPDFFQKQTGEQYQPDFNLLPFSIKQRLANATTNREYDEVIDWTSWSCEHSLDRWKGEGKCTCQNYSPQANLDRNTFYVKLQTYNDTINAYLDRNPGWRNDFAKTVVDLKDKIFGGEPFLADLHNRVGGNEERYRLYAAKLYTLLGLTSCGWFFEADDRPERDLPAKSIQAIEHLIPGIEIKDITEAAKHVRRPS